MNRRSEFLIVEEASRILGLRNQTDGSLFVYKKPQKDLKLSTKPDGYYYYEGITFILDAKAEKTKFSGQLEDYMKLEKNENFVGLKYSGDIFQCYINGKIVSEETIFQNAQYYADKYFQHKITNEDIVNKTAKSLAGLFRDSGIDKQMNVPFIGAVMLCLKYKKEITNNTTDGILRLIKEGLNNIIDDNPFPRKQKKDFIITTLGDPTLKKCKFHDMLNIISEITTIYSFINVSNKKGRDTMNSFLKVFRKWNSANANEKGEVFTPDHIAQLMYRIISINKNDTVLDPTCGSGTFLTNALALMLEESDLEEYKEIKENRVIGIEESAFNATLAGINMLLHDDGASNIYQDDCFKRLPKIKGQYNKVLMNPPFSQKTSELKFVLETLNNMKDGGLCATILPISCALGREHKELRKEILSKHSLIKSIKLNKLLFAPNASVDTCILVFAAHDKRKKQIVEKFDFSNDGFIYKMRVGRVNIDNDRAMADFFTQIPIIEEVDENSDWLIEPLFNYEELTNQDFLKAKIDYLKSQIDYNFRNTGILLEAFKNDGKININVAVNDERLNVEDWIQFPIFDIFLLESKGKDSLDKNNPESRIPCINAKKDNNGIGGFLDNPKKIFEGGKITIVAQGDGGAGMTYYQNKQFCATSSVIVLAPKFNITLNIGLFISKICSLKWKLLYSHGKTITKDVLEKETILLPSKNGQPDWEYIENYMK
ncbi:MAG: N-6 DNA methylase [Metamycoplasmataceae bacterium]